MSILPDVLAPGLAVVFCGTAAGTVSARKQAYYAGPGNAFWPTLFEVGLTPRRLLPQEYAEVTLYGLGLTDLAQTVFGADHVLADEHFDRVALRDKVGRFQPRVLAFTSKRAGSELLGRAVAYGLQSEQLGATRLFVLPSPSGRARPHWDVRVWHELARLRNGS